MFAYPFSKRKNQFRKGATISSVVRQSACAHDASWMWLFWALVGTALSTAMVYWGPAKFTRLQMALDANQRVEHVVSADLPQLESPSVTHSRRSESEQGSFGAALLDAIEDELTLGLVSSGVSVPGVILASQMELAGASYNVAALDEGQTTDVMPAIAGVPAKEMGVIISGLGHDAKIAEMALALPQSATLAFDINAPMLQYWLGRAREHGNQVLVYLSKDTKTSVDMARLVELASLYDALFISHFDVFTQEQVAALEKANIRLILENEPPRAQLVRIPQGSLLVDKSLTDISAGTSLQEGERLISIDAEKLTPADLKDWYEQLETVNVSIIHATDIYSYPDQRQQNQKQQMPSAEQPSSSVDVSAPVAAPEPQVGEGVVQPTAKEVSTDGVQQ